MWNSKKSASLSLICVYVFMVIFVLVEILAVPFSQFLIEVCEKDTRLLPVFIGSIYGCLLPVGYALIILRQMLKSIKTEEAFSSSNIRRLRHLSFCCYLISVICIICGFGYFPYLLIAPLAAFMGLILRVVKNACKRAEELQEDNNMTI